MDTELLVDRRIDDGMQLVAQLVRDGFDVTVAFWAKTREEGLWFLYIASNSVDMKRNLGDSYKRFYASLVKIAEVSISISDVKLINSSNPIALGAIKIRNRTPGRIPIQSRAEVLGGLPVEELYIYPQLGSMTPNEIMQTVIGFMSRRGSIQPSQITLHDGTMILAIPCGIRTVNNAIQIELLDATGIRRSVALDQIAGIQ